jgi:sulfoxide reductase heme-binding subunit YedZ
MLPAEWCSSLSQGLPMIARKLPWNERNGRFSPVKAVVFAALFVPAIWFLTQFALGALAPKPVTELIHRSGDWAVRLILISLLITPLRKLAAWPKLIAVRRMIGVAAFAYAFAHFCLYIVDQKYDLLHVASEIALRFYLTIGFVALLGLAALAATSTDAMIRRLGGPRWNLLHKSIYLIATLALAHYYLQSKADVSDPVLMTGLFLMLMLYRPLQKRLPLWAAAVASVVVGTGATALIEATWYMFRRHYPFWEVLGANIDPDMFPRPTFWVLVAGVVALAVMVARNYRPRLRLAAAE